MMMQTIFSVALLASLVLDNKTKYSIYFGFLKQIGHLLKDTRILGDAHNLRTKSMRM